MSEEKKSFEEKLEEAKAVLDNLSKPELPLDEGVKEYKKGVTLLQEASEMLEEAKLVYQELDDAQQTD